MNRFRILYTEIGDGKVTPSSRGKPYNGHRMVYIKAADEAAALAILRSRYSKGAIKEIIDVVLQDGEHA